MSMLDDDKKLGEVIAKLIVKTDEGRVLWEEVGAACGFTTTIKRHRVTMTSQLSTKVSPAYLFDLYGDGVLLLSIRSDVSSHGSKINELYDIVRRRVYHSNEALDKLLEILESK